MCQTCYFPLRLFDHTAICPLLYIFTCERVSNSFLSRATAYYEASGLFVQLFLSCIYKEGLVREKKMLAISHFLKFGKSGDKRNTKLTRYHMPLWATENDVTGCAWPSGLESNTRALRQTLCLDTLPQFAIGACLIICENNEPLLSFYCTGTECGSSEFSGAASAKLAVLFHTARLWLCFPPDPTSRSKRAPSQFQPVIVGEWGGHFYSLPTKRAKYQTFLLV